MPEISRFFGIVIRMFVEAGAPHSRPHFHAYYQEDVGVFAVDTVEVIGGEIPSRQKRLRVHFEDGTVQTIDFHPYWRVTSSDLCRIRTSLIRYA